MINKTFLVLLWITMSIMNFNYCFGQEDSPIPENAFGPQDMSGMFNERGYQKSGSVSFDEQEIINDFNGNLMYKIPIASGKGAGDLAYEVSLNYNGNVNYIVNTADTTAEFWIHGNMHQYNITAPGWIINFNGFAIQMLNFENNFFTRPAINGTTQGRNVRLLASGYQYTDRFQFAGINSPDKITIMLGDGSTETLENNEDGNETYTGWYRTTSKDSRVLAKVEYVEGDTEPSLYARKRIMYYMKGDGLTYIFEETPASFKDLEYSGSVAPKFRPLIFMLKKVKDRFGNVYALNYKALDADSKSGRRVIESCPGAYFDYPKNFWGSHMGAKISTADGNYVMYMDGWGLEPEYKKRPNLIYLWNPSGEKMTFDYYPYQRMAGGLYKSSSTFFSINFGLSGNYNEPLYKLSRVKNFDGAERIYSYYEHSSQNLDMRPPSGDKGAHSTGSDFKGQGRDLFFTNMLQSAKTFTGSDTIRKIDYEYTYTPGRGDYFANPIDSRDVYTTTKTVSALSGSINNGMPVSNTTVNYYKNYPTKINFTTETTDYDGTLKLVRVDNESSGSLYHKTLIQYDTGSVSVGFYTGSFFETQKTEEFDGITSEWNTNYTSYTEDSVYFLTSKTTTDPFGKKDSVTFYNFSPKDYFYSVFKDGSFISGATFIQAYDSTQLYLIQQPLFEFSKKNNTILAKKENIYFYDTTMSSYTSSDTSYKGYPGQLKKAIIYNPQSNAVFSTVEYEYCNKDTTGIFLYDSIAYFATANEGAVKKIKDPKGNVTVYYYDLISRSEDNSGINNPCVEVPNTDEYNCAPKLTYKKMLDNGTMELMRTNWRDSRFPTRIDRYIDGVHYISNYQKYDEGGNITEIIDNNNYYSKILYDKYYRLAQATLPYDFNSVTPIDTLPGSDTLVADVSLVSTSKFWGTHSLDTITPGVPFGFSSNTSQNILAQNEYPISGIEALPDPEDTTQTDAPQPPHVRALINIYDPAFQYIAEIDSAFIEFSVSHSYATRNDSYFTNYNIQLIPLKKISHSNETGVTYEVGNEVMNLGNLGLSKFFGGDVDSLIIARYDSNFRKINITELLRDNISGNKLNIEGFEFDLTEDAGYISGDIKMKLDFSNANYGFWDYWKTKYLPKIKIYGRQKFVHNYKVLKFNNGTINYEYNDFNNRISVNSKIDGKDSSSRYKKTTNYFDGLRRIYQTRSYTDATNYDQASISYNYLDGKSVVTDGKGNVSKYRYDKYGNIDSTGNADNSYTLGNVSYQNGLSYRFGNVAGLVQKQTLFDETGNRIEKYTDAVGNLRREVRFIDDTEDPTPETIPGMISLITDYHYDALYRVDSVKTPAGKIVAYFYDALGRQTKRITPDAGHVEYRYDVNNNLIYSQDENQRDVSNSNYTFRNYDGLNRLLYIGETDYSSGTLEFDAADTLEDISAAIDNINGITPLCLTINVYDTVTAAAAGSFTVPGDYSEKPVNGKGNLVATAYRTRKTDNWNYKFYRYDARGRVIRMWNVIDGLGTKTTDYLYNSANQVQVFTYQSGESDEKRTDYIYDDAGRLKDVLVTSGTGAPEFGDAPPSESFNFASYHYNQNSQIDTLKLNAKTNKINYSYNSRNWINFQRNNLDLFEYGISYFSNGNISGLGVTGQYNNNFADSNNLVTSYNYDKANRLTRTNTSSGYTHSLDNAYDLDGNITSLQRSSTGNSSDNFTYDYISGTNKLAKVEGSTSQYTYDFNGNMKTDEINKNYDAVYDYRNLLIYISSVRPDPVESKNSDIFVTRYNYDEAGNRTRKMVFKRDEEVYEPEEPNWDSPGDSPSSWTLITDEHYVRDASGKEIVNYASGELSFWNIYGSDNVGRINADTTKQFYIKDHLGTIRAVTNASNEIISAADYDAWGYKLREWDSQNSKYKFTGKERDIETNYDYFGARYYDARIGRWGGVDPVNEISQYIYCSLNPLRFIDKKGLSPSDAYIKGNRQNDALSELKKETPNLTLSMNENGKLDATGEAKTEQEKLLYKAIKDGNVDVNLQITEENSITLNGVEIPLLIGMYNGNTIGQNGKTITYQYLNLNQAAVYEKVGGGSVGQSVMHELLESYIGATERVVGMLNSTTSFRAGYEMAHSMTRDLENPKLSDWIRSVEFPGLDKTEVYLVNFQTMGMEKLYDKKND
ncbi:MAG: hypothetical protein J0M18_00520 [Ignavibacteria bacterium]|nr:hypothetical protein [Ignavibacteria bacterium]